MNNLFYSGMKRMITNRVANIQKNKVMTKKKKKNKKIICFEYKKSPFATVYKEKVYYHGYERYYHEYTESQDKANDDPSAEIVRTKKGRYLHR